MQERKLKGKGKAKEERLDRVIIFERKDLFANITII